MQRVLFMAVVLLGVPVGAQDMPVAALSGGGRGQAPAPAQTRPSGNLPPLPVTHMDLREVTLDSPRRLTLTFAEPRPIDEILALLTAGTPFSLAIDTDATGTFRGDLKQLTLRESLSALLAPLGLDFQLEGTVIRVRRRQAETRLFDVDVLNVQRGLARTSGTAGATLTTAVTPEDVLDGVAGGIKSLLSDRGTVHVNKRAGLVQVTDFPDRLGRVALYLEALQQRSARQVRLQAQAFEVTIRGAAIDWRLVRQLLGLPADGGEAGLAADPAALRAVLAQQGAVRVLWAPDVTILNNEPALMRIRTDGGTSMTMTVVPQIAADGIVQMSVAHAWEEPAGQRKDGWFKSTPVTRRSESDSVVRVVDGNTAVIAGLLRPLREGHAELVVLLRATVVAPKTSTAGNRN